MSISEPFIRRPIGTSLLMLGVLVFGIGAYNLLPVAAVPNVDFTTITVTAQYPGADPSTMASSVATPLETQFTSIPALSQMTSFSGVGVTSITLQFDLNRNIDAAAQDVQTGIDAAGCQLPKNLPTPPTYRKVNPADSPILILAVHSDVLPVTTVDDYAENILGQQISQIPGVAQVAIGGQQKPAVRVQIDPIKLAALGLEITELAGYLQGQVLAVHPAYAVGFAAFHPPGLDGQARTEWAAEQLRKCVRASANLGLHNVPVLSGGFAWHLAYPWPQRPPGLIDEAFRELARRWRPLLDFAS